MLAHNLNCVCVKLEYPFPLFRVFLDLHPEQGQLRNNFSLKVHGKFEPFKVLELNVDVLSKVSEELSEKIF